jgi:hypothetical protein
MYVAPWNAGIVAHASPLANGADAQRSYDLGRASSRKVGDDFARKMADTEPADVRAKANVDRRTLIPYVDFPYNQAVRQIRAGLDQ